MRADQQRGTRTGRASAEHPGHGGARTGTGGRRTLRFTAGGGSAHKFEPIRRAAAGTVRATSHPCPPVVRHKPSRSLCPAGRVRSERERERDLRDVRRPFARLARDPLTSASALVLRGARWIGSADDPLLGVLHGRRGPLVQVVRSLGELLILGCVGAVGFLTVLAGQLLIILIPVRTLVRRHVLVRGPNIEEVNRPPASDTDQPATLTASKRGSRTSSPTSGTPARSFGSQPC